MALNTLQDFLPRIRALAQREAVRYDNGFRHWVHSYQELYRQIAGFTHLLAQRNLGRGSRLLLWCENRPQWLIAFWGSVARGVEIVPLDYRSSPALVKRIQEEVQARLLVHGSQVDVSSLDLPVLPAVELGKVYRDELDMVPVNPGDIFQIVYTSGTTGTPRGVIHRHGNVCANLSPIQEEISRYSAYARPFQPIRILNLLPLSHVFGQAIGLYVPLMLGGAAVLMEQIHPEAIIRVVKSARVSALAVVPRILEALQSEVRRSHGLNDPQPIGRGWLGAARRWWRYRAVHRRFGWKFWCFVVGGAPVPPELEQFWSNLGFAVVQGYGLTESSAVVALNHPFDARPGTLGKAVPGQEVKLAPDGEILVRGPSVATEFVGATPDSGTHLEDGWLHTGDLGWMDESGRIHFLGRKKEVIVTPEGLNVYPRDVEEILRSRPGVRDCVVVGQPGLKGDLVHAVLILDSPELDAGQVVAQANQQLEPHQRVQGWTLWPEVDFPRTASTFKVKRGEVAQRIRSRSSSNAAAESPPDPIAGALQRITGPETRETLDLAQDLGLSSLDRVELLGRLEDQLGVHLDETRLAELATTRDLRAEIERLQRGEAGEQQLEERPSYPYWARGWAVSRLRSLLLDWVLLPLQRRLIQVEARGLERLSEASPPVIFAANHSSHLDTSVILAALPRSWRHRVAPAMRKEYFRPYFQPNGYPFRERVRTAIKYWLACGLFHAYPLPQRMGGVRSALEFTGYLVDRGDCPLIFPEGARSGDGKLLPFHEGVGLMALELQVPVVPVYIRGTAQVWSKYERRPTRRGVAWVVFGEPLDLQQEADPRSATRRVEEALRRLESETPTEG